MHSENRARRLTVTGCLFKFKNKKGIALTLVGPHDPSVTITKILGLLDNDITLFYNKKSPASTNNH